MKANELMIGDLLKPKNVDSYFKVGLIGADSIWNDTDTAKWDLDEIEPIPLTPEILEKNGWKNCVPDVWQNEYRGFFFYWENGTGRFGMDDFRRLQEQWKMHLQIKHIHELQHALRLCGIEKEITI